MNKKRPTRISLNITKRCNLKCRHCFSDSGEDKKKELTAEELYSLIDQMEEMECNYIAIGGGEPLMREDLFDILEYAYKKHVQASIVTNCLLMTREKAQRLNKLGVKKVKVSLDGMKENHDKVRGRGVFKKTIEKIRLLRTYFEGDIQIGFTVNSENIEDCKNIVKLAEELKADSVRLAPILPLGRARENKELLLSQDQFLHFIEKTREVDSAIEVDLPDKARITRENEGFGCHCGKEVCWILENGDFYSCIFLGEQFKLGNIKRSNLKELWGKSKKASAFPGNEICNNCLRYKECRGGCRARALYTYNDVNAVDPFCLLKKMRLPYQVLIIPYKRDLKDFKFLILKRSDFGFWQWVSGGGESEDDGALNTIVRELREEINVSVKPEKIIKLESRNTIFEDEPLKYKNRNITVIPEYAFGVELKDDEIKISKEHKEYRWVTKKEAEKLLKYDSNKTALSELNKLIRKEVDGSWKIHWEF